MNTTTKEIKKTKGTKETKEIRETNNTTGANGTAAAALAKNYDPKQEDALYSRWMARGYFAASPNPAKKPFTIVMPPPNITGQLHIGHALNNTVQDILIRSKRMQGYEALWMPGTDHAAIATEVRIVQEMAKEGLTKEDIGRDAYLERAWAWKAQYGGRIIEQLKKMGASCDWARERFTMDEGLSNAVLEVFVRLYEEGKIYRGDRLVNWCVKCQTTISDAEVEHEEQDSQLYYFKYPVEGTTDEAKANVSDKDYIAFATTRPETMLGDTAIAVSPEDPRYGHLVGKMAVVPTTGRRIPIIADTYVDPTFGTGVVKITPAHDPNDFEVGERHNLPRINIFNDDGTVNENGGRYAGLTREAARSEIIREMDKLGLFIKTEPLKHAVGTHDRCHQVVEPLIKLQWFVKMDELAKPAIEAYTAGKLRFNRERYGKVYLHWLTHIKDWCVSRQLWWGHRIPAYYCEHGHVTVAKTAPAACGTCGSPHLTQDPDTLDTWFSSALWPFSTLGWPEKTPELAYFYPNNVLVTAYEIIFNWVVRMVFTGCKFIGECPFPDVFITGIVRDAEGRKMSKSLGNGIDPLEVVDQYGADALRLMLVTGNALDNDTRFYWERMDFCRNFLNKLWNATRFTLMNIDSTNVAANGAATIGNGTDGDKTIGNGTDGNAANGAATIGNGTDGDKTIGDGTVGNAANGAATIGDAPLCVEDRWIRSRLNGLVKEVTEKLDAYELGMASQKIVDFIWDEFCDWYVEMVKPRLYGDKNAPEREAALQTLQKVLLTAVKLLHPFTPFITETLFLSLQDEEETVMLSAWPVYDAALADPDAEKAIELVKETVRAIRNTRAEKNVPPARKIKVLIAPNDGEAAALFTQVGPSVAFLAGASEVAVVKNTTDEAETSTVVDSGLSAMADAVSVVVSGATLYLPLSGLVDAAQERARLNKEKKRLMQELARVAGKLSNEGFLAKAPAALIAEEQAKREKFTAMLAKVEEELN